MVIGLTGGIATGKSTVSRMFTDLGATLIDADQIARQVVEPKQMAWGKIKERFGEEILLEDGSLDRKQLGRLIFNDPQARLDLNRMIHPFIRQEMVQQRDRAIRQGQNVIVMDIPLLFENQLEYLVDKTLVVYIPEQEQLLRLMERDHLDTEEALQKINSQIPIEEKKKRGDAIIDNSGTISETKQQLDQILQQWKLEENYET